MFYYIIIIYKAVARLFEAQCRSAALHLKTWKYWAELLTRHPPRGDIFEAFSLTLTLFFLFSLIIWLNLSTNQKIFYVTKYSIDCLDGSNLFDWLSPSLSLSLSLDQSKNNVTLLF